MLLRSSVYTVLEKENLDISKVIYCWHHSHLCHSFVQLIGQ